METIWLQRPSGDIPWGFRLQGGREFAQPLSVQRVTPGSVAASSNGIAPGDVVLKIGNVNATNITHNEAQEVITGATNILQLTIKKATAASAPVSPTSGSQFSSVNQNAASYAVQDDKYAFPDYRVGSGYQAYNNSNEPAGFNSQENSPYDMRQFEQTPPISGYSTLPVRSGNKQSTDGFRPVQPSQQQQQQPQNKYPYKSTSGIKLQLKPQTQSAPRQNEYSQPQYNDRGSYSQPMSPVQFMNGNRNESAYQRQTSVGQNRPDTNTGYPQSHFKKPTPFTPGYSGVNYQDANQQPPRLQRQTSSGNQAPSHVFESTISPGVQQGNYNPWSDDAPPPPPPPTNYQPDPYNRPYEQDAGRTQYTRQASNPQQASYGSSPYEQRQNDYNAYQSRQQPNYESNESPYQRQGSRPYEPQPPPQQYQRQPSNPNYYDQRSNQPMTPTRMQGQPSYSQEQQYGSPDPYSQQQQAYCRQQSREQPQQYARQTSRDQAQPMSRQHSRDQHIEPPTYTHPASPPGNQINTFDDVLSPFENFQNSNYCDKLFSRSPDNRGDIDSGLSMSSDTPRSNQSASYSPPQRYPTGYDDRSDGLLRPAPQAPPLPPVTPPPPPPPPPPSDWTPPQQQQQPPRRKLPPETPHSAQGEQQIPDAVLNTMMKHGGTQKPFAYIPSGDELKKFKEKARQRRQPRVMPRGYVGPDVEDEAQAEAQSPAMSKAKPGAMPNPDTGVYKHAQYNSPLRVYSSDNAKDAFNVQSGGMVDVSGVDNNTPERRESDIKESDVYKMCKTMDAQGNRPKKARDPLLRHNSVDDEMRFSGLHTKADIPSKAFHRLNRIAGGDSNTLSPTPNQNKQEEDDEDQNRVGNYDEASIRYRGNHIPSPSFRLLQTLAKEDEMKNKAGSPSTRTTDSEDDGMPDKLNAEDMVDKRYVGGNIPSKSFRALKLHVEDEQKSGQKIKVGRPKSPQVPPKPQPTQIEAPSSEF
ncbi:trithorax group protein osa-like isoform X1 [Mya arenaria]|uniref:trithorax group protein osa-like isoform X1 n=1 Tax=Mya arenaria TaxID=6604 RepID=UPI0022E30E6B|nr:trithorax group protein osa-like isoform X1 [Mya arenaria]XP_052763675.1 trithorax group protein osa-like isoform X1 [Mya arenaria]